MNFFTRSLYHILKRRRRDDVGCWIRCPGRSGPTPHTQSTVAIIIGRYGMRESDVVVSSSMGQFIWGFGGQLIGSIIGREVGVMIMMIVIALPLFILVGGANAVAPAGRLHRLYLRAQGAIMSVVGGVALGSTKLATRVSIILSPRSILSLSEGGDERLS